MTGMHDGMEKCMLITTDGRNGLTAQHRGEGDVNGVWCRGTTRRGRRCKWSGEGWCI